MTMGFTGVVWMPRGATWNSTALNAGVGPVQLSAAGVAWTNISAGLLDASATMTKVMGELRVGWEGLASDAALAKLIPFTAWTEESTAMATTTAAKAAAAASTHSVARITMPSLPEIAAVKTAKVVAHTVGGSLAGAGAAAEAADRAMDLRAALVMESYEAASTAVSVPQSFTPPPPLATGAQAPGAGTQEAVPTNKDDIDWRTNPAGAAMAAVMAQAQNPAVVSAASQAGSIAGAGFSTVTSTATSLAPAAVSAITGGGSGQSFGGFAASPTAGAGTGGRSGSGSGSGATRTMTSAGGMGRGGAGGFGGGGAGRATLPEGWGRGAGGGLGGGVTGVPGASEVFASGTARAEAAMAAGPRGGQLGAPMMGGAAGGGQDDEEHHTPAYLKNFEHFSDGRVVIPAVLGADPQEYER
ncbi:PPE domain-containing protein [Rhodococcus oryzae]|uniref:PPE domain-containing protein n=1 Tax=Rhodococcus oryzae TaxID=2571143 RepID=A0ABY2RD04_9NOCA|nr:PPE domain-containing protein [Rhodococcus oryzae]TJZ73244.1 PPE domain-containing protein [Rhodococcus oryzae]